VSTVVHEQVLDTSIVSRSVLIGKLRAALNAAESGEDVVHIEIGNVEVDVDYASGELTVYA
jgi:hypothetical protein